MGKSQYILPGGTLAFYRKPKPKLTNIFITPFSYFQYLRKTGPIAIYHPLVDLIKLNDKEI